MFAMLTGIDTFLITGGILLGVLVIVFILLLVLSKKKNKNPKVIINQEFLNDLIRKLGTKENINKISVENQKLIVDVKNLDLVKLDEIKEMANSGVFVTGTTIKTLFKYDSALLKREIDRLGEWNYGKNI